MGSRRGKRIAWTIAALGLAVLGVYLALARKLHRENEARRHLNLGVALIEAGAESADQRRFSEALAEFDEALRLSPDGRAARFNRALALYLRDPGDPSGQARAQLGELLGKDPGDLHARYLLGLLDEEARNWQGAAEGFQAVLEKDPADARAWLRLGNGCLEIGQSERAIAALRQAASLSPKDSRPQLLLARTLRKAGDDSEWQKEMARWKFLHETRSSFQPDGMDFPLRYPGTALGKYAQPISESRSVIESGEPPPEYRDVTATVGIDFLNPVANGDPRIREVLSGAPTSRNWFESADNRRLLASALGAGASFVDWNGDGWLDVFLVSTDGRHALFESNGGGRFSSATEKAGLPQLPVLGMACVWGDYDNDGSPDLFISGQGDSRLYRNDQRMFQDVTEKTGVASSIGGRWCMGAAFADTDHDGDLDLLVPALVDLCASVPKPELRFPADFSPEPLIFFQNDGLGSLRDHTSKAFPDGAPAGKRSVLCTDLDADGAIDLVAFDLRGGAEAWRNRRDGTFRKSKSPDTEWRLPPAGESWALGDFDQDGATDLLVNRSGGRASLARNLSVPRNWLTVRLKGQTNSRVPTGNAAGIGSTVEARSAGLWRRKWLSSGNGAQGSDAAEVTFYLWETAKLDYVRAYFPSGARKCGKEVLSNRVITLEEPVLVRMSCPAVFSQDGERFRFITDTLSAGVLGELTGPGEYWNPDPDEWLRITGEELKPSRSAGSADSLEIRFTNPLEEIVYLDQARLVAVDHPPGLEVYPGERMVNDPRNRAPVKVYALKDVRAIAGAALGDGREVADKLAAADRCYVSPPKLLPFEGFAEDWTLELDLGAGRPEVLLLQSWSAWNTSASVIAGSQAGKRLWGPVLQVLDKDGKEWRMGMDDLGVSAGLPRMVLVDLRGVLREGERRARIRSNRILHYDQALVAGVAEAWDPEEAKPATCHASKAPLRRSELRWLGYPERRLPGGNPPEVYDYSRIEPEAEWATHQGFLTRYGEVTPLLLERDDRFAVFRHGEEVALSFSADGLPPLPTGWRRTWLFYSAGYEKGHEIQSGLSPTVAPLPHRAVPGNPAEGPRYPLDEDHLRYLEEWNTRPSFLAGPR